MSFWSKLFKKEKTIDPIDLSEIGVDMHSHLIPAIDDGSKSMEDSVEMIRRLKEMGYQKIITSPHVMSDFYKNTPEIINSGKEEVIKALKQLNIEVEFGAAAEYYLDETLEDKVASKTLLTMGDNYVLFELPFMSEPPNLASFIFTLQTSGYKAILAHPERYGYWYDDFEKYRELHQKGVHLQLNMLSLIGHYSPQTRKIAEQLIDENLVTFLGTDCHNQGHIQLMDIARRKPYLKKLIDSGKLRNKEL